MTPPETTVGPKIVRRLEAFAGGLERDGERPAKQRPLFSWPGVLVAVLVGLLLGAVLVSTCWGAG